MAAVAVSISGFAIPFFSRSNVLSLALIDKRTGVAVFWPAAGVASGILVGARSDRALAGRHSAWSLPLSQPICSAIANLASYDFLPWPMRWSPHCRRAHPAILWRTI
jgi:hypothetical protein